MEWKRTNPVYPVADVAAAIEWYQGVLGLVPGHVNQAPDGPNYAVLDWKGQSFLHLLRQKDAEHGETAPASAQIWIDGDLDALFDRVTSFGARVIRPPADQPWGARDFTVADPDGNLVWFSRALGG